MGRNLGRKLRSSWKVFSVGAALAMALLVVPALGQEAEEGQELLRLHVGSDEQFLQYEPDGDPGTQASPNDPGVVRNDLVSQRCELSVVEDASARPLVAGSLASFDEGGTPGLNGISIGVKTGNSQGVPCGRVDSTEELVVTLGEVGGRQLIADAAEFDLELKGSANVDIQLLLDGTAVGDPFRLVSGQGSGNPQVILSPQSPTGECQGASDSGPDAGERDNCRVMVHPDSPFNGVSFTLSAGEISLEGSGDFGNDRAADTIFFIGSWEGALACDDDPATDDIENSTGEQDDGDVVVEIIRHFNADLSECGDKLFLLTPDAEDEQRGSVIFEVADPEAQRFAFFETHVTFKEDVEGELWFPLQGTLQYDPDGSDEYNDFKDMPACMSDPLPDGTPDAGAIPGFPGFDDEGALEAWLDDPERHDGCVIDVTQEFDGTTIWHAVFMGDWKFR